MLEKTCASILLSFFAFTVNATPITLDFPSSDSQIDFAYGTNTLGVGGGGDYFNSGDKITETFTGTGLASADESHWVFEMSNYTESGVINTFDVFINSIDIGGFSFTGQSAGYGGTQSFDLNFSHAPILGDNFTLEIIATSTVFSGGGAWNWLPGGSVTLDGSASVPEPSSIALLAFGLAGLSFSRKKKAA
ncbi:MAG: PEP-CTERM sorting domain-containing protein [Candidatus Brocadiaceae bacterium]|nr:PEP-CTERM sorting domain-containing protein [Candidatus Brocadiaceae bacterium]